MDEVCKYKVPFRQVYCETLSLWLKETVWCHLVLRVFPHALDLGSEPVETYLEEPVTFFQQHELALRRVRVERIKARFLAQATNPNEPRAPHDIDRRP